MKRSNPNDLVKHCLMLLQLRGVLCWRNNTGSLPTKSGGFIRFGTKGSGDIFAIMPGGTFASIEVKTGKGRLSPAQKEFAAAVEKAGGMAVCVWSLADLDSWLRDHGVRG